jgi:hypothetical protein
MDTEDKTVQISTDSLITLQSLENRKNHTNLIDEIRREVAEMEKEKWKITFSWIKAHAGNQGNELANNLAKEAANDRDMPECYNRLPQSSVRRELREYSITRWQNEWDATSKGAMTKSFFPIITETETKNKRHFKLYNNVNRSW